jgi:glycosyltransferase involved in cell wall biosynthesis
MRIAMFHDGSWFHRPLKEYWEIAGHEVKACPNYSEWGIFDPDVIFFDMCTSNLVFFSKNRIKGDKKVFCRIHGVGMRYSSYKKVDWNEKVDGIIFVNSRLKKEFTENMPQVTIPMTIISNGVDLKKFTLKKNMTPTYKLAFVGRWINLKGIDLLDEIVEKFKKIDKRYEVYSATGDIPDEKMNAWLEDKDYLIHPSRIESFCYAVAEAMAKGIRPLIGEWDGAAETFGDEFLIKNWNLAQDPHRIRSIISTTYDQKTMLNKIEKF